MNCEFVSGYADRHGKMRYRFRRAGFHAPLPAPESEAFAAEYERLLAEAPPTPIRTPQTPVGKLRALCRKRGWPLTGEFVYFIQCRGLVKIGFSAKILNRLAELTAQNPTSIRLLAAVQGGRSLERRLHALLADDRVKGEWFRRSDAVKALIADARRGGTFANIG